MTETALSFEDLSEEAKEKAREKFREYHLDHDWWDSVYEDAKERGKELGIEINDIQFTGFCSQGDVACFHGEYRHNANAIQAVTESCPQDEKLKQIAEALTVFQTAASLQHGTTFHAQCTPHFNSNWTSVEVFVDNKDIVIDDYASEAAQLRKTLRSFADWIYKNLEAEYDYLMSDECIDQYLADLSFDEDGSTI